MKKSLVGYTGFVGSNICYNQSFDGLYNSKNIKEAYGTTPDLLIYSGIRAEMFLANSNPTADFHTIKNAIENIKKINPKNLVLVSTIAVYDNPNNVNENSPIDDAKLNAYGKNRRHLEKWVENNLSNYLILRLPAIYGENLKKNFIYDIITCSPSFLTQSKFEELCKNDSFIKDYYVLQDNGFYRCLDVKIVKPYFENIGFSALNFTDSRSIFQFYNLKYLWSHINYALKNNIKKLNLSTEPISASELYEYIYKKSFTNILSKKPFNYNVKTNCFSGGYIFYKKFVLEDIKKFVLKKGENEIIGKSKI